MSKNPLIYVAQMSVEHLSARLRALSEQRSPAPSAVPVIVLNEWCLLHEAARRLEQLQYDVETYRRSASNTSDDWPYWAIVREDGKIVDTTQHGKAVALGMLEDFTRSSERARAWNVRPMYVGGCTNSQDDERSGHD